MAERFEDLFPPGEQGLLCVTDAVYQTVGANRTKAISFQPSFEEPLTTGQGEILSKFADLYQHDPASVPTIAQLSYTRALSIDAISGYGGASRIPSYAQYLYGDDGLTDWGCELVNRLANAVTEKIGAAEKQALMNCVGFDASQTNVQRSFEHWLRLRNTDPFERQLGVWEGMLMS